MGSKVNHLCEMIDKHFRHKFEYRTASHSINTSDWIILNTLSKLPTTAERTTLSPHQSGNHLH